MVHGNVETVVCYDNHQAGPWHRWHTFLMQQSSCYFKPSLIVVLISKRIFHEHSSWWFTHYTIYLPVRRQRVGKSWNRA